VGRVAVVGAGPAGLECALSLARAGVEDVVLFEAADRIGGQLAIAAAAPHRTGWAPLLDFYASGLAAAGVDVRLGAPASDLDSFDGVVMAVGASETSSPGGAITSSQAMAPELTGAGHVVVVDDGFGWWPGVNAVELALEAGARVTFVTPGTAFAGGIPPESRVQLLKRLAGELDVLALTAAVEVTGEGVTVRRTGGRTDVIAADRVVVVGERRSREAPACAAPLVLAVGDAIVPRRAAHAIAEGRAAAVRVAAGVRDLRPAGMAR
jgi:2,4-dienoyl-CoA reductase (NADPH2)